MSREFLYELLSTASVSGFERIYREKLLSMQMDLSDEIYTDEIADVVSVINPRQR